MASAESAVLEQGILGRQRQAASREESRPETCRLCTQSSGEEIVDAGGDIGRVRRKCFVEWDRHQEALEVLGCVAFFADPGELRTELEMEATSLPRAA
jgi:hypothetical protein